MALVANLIWNSFTFREGRITGTKSFFTSSFSRRKCLPLPKVSTVKLTKFSQASGVETSVGQILASRAPLSRHACFTSSNFSLRLAASTNFAPFFAYSRAMHCHTNHTPISVFTQITSEVRIRLKLTRSIHQIRLRCNRPKTISSSAQH